MTEGYAIILGKPVTIRFHFRHWLPLILGVDGITFGRSVFFALRRDRVSHTLWAHELIHVLQYEERGMLKFLWEYLVGWIRRGYWRHPLEVAARVEAKLLLENTHPLIQSNRPE